MKTYYLLSVLILTFSSFSANAQFKKAEIKVYGLTCSLCSRSVEMALQKVDFVESIKTDLETTLTTITFKEGSSVAPEELAKAVDKAGFSVGYIKVTYNFQDAAKNCAEGEEEAFTMVEDGEEISAGVHTLLLIEKDMMSGKMYKDYKNDLPDPCETAKRHYYVALADQLILN